MEIDEKKPEIIRRIFGEFDAGTGPKRAPPLYPIPTEKMKMGEDHEVPLPVPSPGL